MLCELIDCFTEPLKEAANKEEGHIEKFKPYLGRGIKCPWDIPKILKRLGK